MNKPIGTVCFFKKHNKVLLFLIKYPDGSMLWNEIGGYIKNDESPVSGLVREVKEEIGIALEKNKIKFVFEKEYPNMKLFVYIYSNGLSDIKLIDHTIERYEWFDINNIPYQQMFEDNKDWLPKILSG